MVTTWRQLQITPKATPVNNVQTPVKEPAKSPVASEGETKANELPQTGDEQNNALAAVGASIIAGLLGIIGFAKKKDDEKENWSVWLEKWSLSDMFRSLSIK